MPVRDLAIAVSLLALVLLIAFIGDAVGSEYYFFLGDSVHAKPVTLEHSIE